MTDEIVTGGKPWAKQVIELYREGASDAEVAAELNVTIKKYYEQINDNQTFRQLVEFGRTLSQAFWESLARKNVKNKGFNTPIWTFYMKNKYGWADKTEAINMNDTNITDLDTLRTQINKDVMRFIKDNTPELTDAQRVLTAMGQDIG